MEEQYQLFVRLKYRGSMNRENYIERECALARRHVMDANAFLVSLRRRGFTLALQEMGIERTIIDEDNPTRQVVVGDNLTLFVAHDKLHFAEPDSLWSSMYSRA